MASGDTVSPESRDQPRAAGQPSEARQAALEYVVRWNWPVMVGAALDECSCGRQSCPHDNPCSPANVHSAVLEATLDPARVQGWWERRPQAEIITTIGPCFEAITVSALAGRRVLDELTERGAWLGPALSDDDTLTLLIQPGQGQHWAELLAECRAEFAHADEGQWLTLPPSSVSAGHYIRWVVPPTSANVDRLPNFEDLGALVATTTHQCHRKPIR